MDIKKDPPIEIPKEKSHAQDILCNQPIANSIEANTLDLMNSREFDSLKILLFDTFSNLDNISNSFLSISPVLKFNLGSWPDSFENSITLINALTTLFDHLENNIQKITSKNALGLLVCTYLPLLQEIENSILIMPKLCKLLADLDPKQQFEFAFVVQESIQFSGSKPSDQLGYFKTIIQLLQQYLTLLLIRPETGPTPDDIVEAVQSLAILAAINETNHFIPFNEFYNETVEEMLDLKEDFPKWKSKEGFSYCNYPFLLSTVSKGDILRIDGMIQMRAMFIGVNNPYLQIEVRRSHVIRDTLFQLQGKNNHDLKKQLRVSFVGEDGIDEGGIQKEFFQIIANDIFSPSSGLFVLNPESRTTWFSFWGNEIDKGVIEEYELLGKLMGLAFYNGVSLDINFTPILYKKILGSPLTLSDLSKFDPSLGLGLTKLLEYTGDVEEDYQRSFEIELTTPTSQKVLMDLIPNGKNIPVSAKNRQDYVNAYIDVFFNTTISQQFDSFLSGFNTIMDGTAIRLFRAEELNELICGSASLDFDVLEKSTLYDGYESTTPIIIYFWEIVHEFTDDEKRQLLIFTTGSDRVPVGGLSKLQFVIARNGTDSDRLPTSHTCFNALLLSEYCSKEKLKDRLMLALANRNCGFYLN